MEIYGPSRVDSAQSIRATQQVRSIEPQASAESVQGMDQIDISPEAELVSRIQDIPDIRAEKVTEIRAQIEAGIYETDEKMDVALGRLLDEIG